MDKRDVTSTKAEIEKTLSEKFSTKGNMAAQVKKSRNQLPRSVAKDVAYIQDAEKMLKHPKLRKQIDGQKVKAAKKRIIRSTKNVEIEEKDRKGDLLSWVRLLIINLVVAAIVIFGAAYLFGAFSGQA